MKRAILFAVGLMAFLGGALTAQSITGTWQGTLSGGDNSRVVIKIEKAGDGSLHGGLMRIDSSADGLPLTSITFAAPDVTLTLDSSRASFQGKLAADGRSIEGTWTQPQQSFPLTLALTTPETVWRHEGPAPPAAMPASADPAFEVAIVKPTGPSENQTQFDLRARKFNSQHTSAKELIKIAYNVRGRQVLGGPPWLEDDKFDVLGEPDTEGMPSEQQNRTMVRKLLEERFHLVAHTGQQAFPVLAVSFDKSARALRATDPEFNGHGNLSSHTSTDGQVVVNFSGETMAQFIGFLMNIYQQNQLVDETGLTATYDFTLTIPISELQGPSTDPDAEGLAFIAAAKQIGFRFTAKKEPIPVVVVEHIEKPSAN